MDSFKTFLEKFSDPVTLALLHAIAVFVIGALLSIRVRKNGKKLKSIPFIVTLFCTFFCLYWPVVGEIVYPEPSVELCVIKRFALTFYQSFKVFTGDGKFKEVRSWLDGLNNTPDGLKLIYEWFCILVCIAALLCVTTVILSLFKELKVWARFWVCERKAYLLAKIINKKTKGEDLLPCIKYCGICVFSELNEKSLALAKNIKAEQEENSFLKYKWQKNLFKYFTHGTFIFYDVYTKNEEKSVELRNKAEEMGAIIFRKDIRSFEESVKCKSCLKNCSRIEFFLIGENESENISQAIELTEKYKNRYNTQIFVWTGSPESAVIIDSFNKIDDNTNIEDSCNFKVRRVDDVERYVWDTLKDEELFKNKNGENADKLRDFISILIVGMGKTGREFLKTATWMYQMEGVRLEINAVDLTDKTAKVLHAQCPELLDMNDCTLEGEAHYSIRFFDNVNIFEDDPTDEMSFRNLLLGDSMTGNKLAKRLKRTTNIFVALGDDDLNIRGAMELRALFERAKFKGFCTESPRIITQVYDSVKAQNVMKDSNCILKTHKNDGFDIRFNGSFDKLYQYKNVNRQKDDETAIKYHLQWCEKVEKEEKEKKEEEYRFKRDYNQYEYYRRSSEAECIHKAMLKKVFGTEVKCKYPENDIEKATTDSEKIEKMKRLQKCNCEICKKTRCIEHMRWNAYMRSIGYLYPPQNSQKQVMMSIAKYHALLIPFDKLPVVEQNKDGIIV